GVHGHGWYYDDFTSAAGRCGSSSQRISFTLGAEPAASSILRLECSQTVPGDLEGADVGSACLPSGTECEMTEAQLDAFVVRYNLPGTHTASPLVCDDYTNTCQVGCNSDADCPGGYVCFSGDDNPGSLDYCVDPTCQQN